MRHLEQWRGGPKPSTGLDEKHRVLKSGGTVLVHDTHWRTFLWQSSDPDRMAKIMKLWDGHLADPHLPATLGRKLADAGFEDIRVHPIVQLETKYDPSSTSAILLGAISGYVASQGVPQSEVDAWATDLTASSSNGDYFCSWNEYIFTASKP